MRAHFFVCELLIMCARRYKIADGHVREREDMDNKRLITIVSTVIMVFAVLITCASCSKKKEQEIHGNQSSQSSQETPNTEIVVGSEGLEYTLSEDETYYALTGIGTCLDSDVIVASFYNGLPVKAIDSFYNCDFVTSITLPNSITSIGKNDFSGCSSLRYNEYNGASYLGNESNPFLALISAKSNMIKSCEVHKDTRIIADDAFNGCKSLTSVTTGDSLAYIGIHAFSGCSSLTTITIPDSIISIGLAAFNNCNSLQFNGYDGAYYLGNEDNPYSLLMKAKDKSLTTCKIHKDTKIIAHSAFYECKSITNITLPYGMRSIGRSAFGHCVSLTDMEIPNSVIEIGESAFSGCKSLKNVNIPEGLQSIKDSTFYNCASLTSIEIPNSVVKICEYAFSGCKSFKSITIPGSVKNISSCAFKDCISITNVTIPNSVKRIYSCAFEGCTSLANVIIPNSVTVIAGGVFNGCTSLQYNEYDNAYYLGNESNPFYVLIEAKSSKITGCEIHEDTKLIANCAFEYCKSLDNLVIPNSVTNIGYHAFHECNQFFSVTFENTSGWHCSGSGVREETKISANDLSDMITAGTYLRSTYDDYHWYRSEE